MRYSADHKQETHRRIVRAASLRFRGHGGGGVAIADLMRELKLTHGGFYRHFNSKEQLFAEAVTQSMEDVQAKLTRPLDKQGSSSPLKVIIETYLSPGHCANPAEGCPVAVLVSEVARHPLAVRASFDRALQAYMKGMAEFLPGKTESERQRNFLILFSGMAGTLGLARAVADEPMRRRILRGAKEFYIKAFCR